MKKTVKTTVTFALVAALASAGFSQSALKSSENPMRPDVSVPNGIEGHKNFKKFAGQKICAKTEDEVLIGKVKSVNLKSNEITVTNSDGKDVVVKISPFTKVNVEITDQNFKRLPPKEPAELPKSGEMTNPNEKGKMPKIDDISEIRSGSWVLVSLFKSETKSLNAESVFAKVRESLPVDNANAK
ncbi:MAG: hypothetical protein SOT81_06880 [Treponema sp.]|nr:hypothetical protein [Treponema sp.]